MALLSKPHLFHIVESAFRNCGWSFLYLPPVGQHPARYQIYNGERSHIVRAYIWNLTHGGRNRPVDEWRIQVTGVERFEPEIGGKTLILGWRDDIGVFAGFDFSHHRGDFGASPSIQIREAALNHALDHGFAVHNKGNGELSIGFRPDFLAAYIENLEALHECGEAENEIELLQQIGDERNEITDDIIEQEVAERRRYAIKTTRRAIREIDFRDRVLTAYAHRCAMCDAQLRLLDGAHILPVAHPNSTDRTDNGIALCVLHHRAFDRAFVTFGADYQILVNEQMIEELRLTNRAGGLDAFRQALRQEIAVPHSEADRPSRDSIELGNNLRGWAI